MGERAKYPLRVLTRVEDQSRPYFYSKCWVLLFQMCRHCRRDPEQATLPLSSCAHASETAIITCYRVPMRTDWIAAREADAKPTGSQQCFRRGSPVTSSVPILGKPLPCGPFLKKLLQFWFSHIKAEWVSS